MKELRISLTDPEYVAIIESADRSSDGATAWAKRVTLAATVTSDDRRLAIRAEIAKAMSVLMEREGNQ